MPAAALDGHPPMVKTDVPGVCAGRRGGACTPSLAAALVGAPQQRLASAKSAASTKLWKRPGLPPGMRQHSPCDHPPTCRQQWSALTSPTAWHHDRWSCRLARGAARLRGGGGGARARAPQINRWNNQPGSRHAILDQRFDRSENSDLSFAELHACSQPAAMQRQPATTGLQTM